MKLTFLSFIYLIIIRYEENLGERESQMKFLISYIKSPRAFIEKITKKSFLP